MKRFTKWGSFIRRLSVFYIFLAIIAGLLLLYYYYYVPSNQSQFSQRGNRELKRLVDNFLKKSAGLQSTFAGSKLDSQDFRLKKGAYEKLNENIPYEVDTQKISGSFIRPAIRDTNNWSIIYPANAAKNKKWAVFITIKEFASQLFDSPSDIFDSYALLMKDTLSKWNIIYKQNDLTTSSHLTLDTLTALQKNSDLSALIDLQISGNDWKLFFRPFEFNNSQLAIAGLVTKRNYNNYVRNTPVKFIAICVILLIVVIISLPFIKVYFLSPNEIINARDVLLNTLSIFLGTTALLIIMNYIYVYTISERAFHNRMTDIAGQVTNDMESEFDKADAQLDYYTRTYDSLPLLEKNTLYYDTTNKHAIDSVDTKFCPLIYPNMTRVLWVDSAGNTLAKWNPFSFTHPPPLTKVNDYQFFNELKKVPYDSTITQSLIIYPGKSNTTGEYQVYIAKHDRQLIKTGNKDTPFVRSIGVLLATSLNCNMYPVMPPGFSFCVIDPEGNVLWHSDSRRNLSENIFAETRDNGRLLTAISYRTSSFINDLVLFGAHQDLYIKPIKGQPLSLVILFNKRSITNNISRLLHFSITCLLGLFIVVAACVFFSTFKLSGNPHKIKFNLEKIEWVRPSAGNKYSYEFTKKYFGWLSVFYCLAFLTILLFKMDIRNLLYLSLLVPLYTIWGFIISRKHLVNKYITQASIHGKRRALKDSLIRFFIDAIPVVLILVLLNIALFHSVRGSEANDAGWNFVILGMVQLISLGMLVYHYQVMLRKLPQNKDDTEKGLNEFTDNKEKEKIRENYLTSLQLSLVLISILPTLGIFNYAFFSEKIQYKKKKEIYAASEFYQRYINLKDERIRQYKPVVKNRLSGYFDTLLNEKSIYLSDRDTIQFTKNWDYPKKMTIYDEPYRYITDHLYQHTITAFGEFTISNFASDNDTSWRFTRKKDSIILQLRDKRAASVPLKMGSRYQNPLYGFIRNFLHGGFIFLLAIVLFLMLEWKLMEGTMSRLFLLNFSDKQPVDDDYLNNFFLLTSKDSFYCKGTHIPYPVDIGFFKSEETPDIAEYSPDNFFSKIQVRNLIKERIKQRQEQYILKMTLCFAPVYEKIWQDQSEEERYFLFDLARDGYSNYKNADIIFRLIYKGILVQQNFRIKFFSLSFRNFILSKKGIQEIDDLKSKFANGGMWQSIRIPVYMILAGFIAFFVLTQNEMTHRLTAFISSVAAIGPLLIEFISKGFSKDK